MTKPFKLPKTLGACADMLYTLREERAEIQKKADAIEAREKLLKEHVILHLSKEQAEGVVGKLAKASVQKKTVAQAKDWDAFYAHVLKTKDFSLLQKRLNDASCREHWENKEVVPGIEPFTVLTVSVNKVR